jgi:YVTN family beta-propeller protein
MCIRNQVSRKSALLGTLALSGALLLPSLPSVAESAAGDTPPSVELISPRGVVLNPATNKVYAVDPAHKAVAIIDVAAHTSRSVKVGDDPLAIAVNSTSDRVYVLNTTSGTVSVLDGKTDTVVATVNVGKWPYVLAANPAENKVYVSNIFRNAITIIDGATNTTKTVNAGSADAMVIDAKRNKVFLLGYEASSLLVLNGSDNSLSRMPVGAVHLWGIALDDTSATLYVTRIGNGDVVAIDENAHTFTPIGSGQLPCAVAVNAKTNTVYVANYGDDSVTVIDGVKRVAVTTVLVGSRPLAIAVDSQNNRIYVANMHGNSVTVIDGSSNKVVATLPAGSNPYAIALDAAGAALFVANLGEPSVTRIDLHPPQKTSE